MHERDENFTHNVGGRREDLKQIHRLYQYKKQRTSSHASFQTSLLQKRKALYAGTKILYNLSYSIISIIN
jgi:hypothetical protein